MPHRVPQVQTPRAEVKTDSGLSVWGDAMASGVSQIDIDTGSMRTIGTIKTFLHSQKQSSAEFLLGSNRPTPALPGRPAKGNYAAKVAVHAKQSVAPRKATKSHCPC